MIDYLSPFADDARRVALEQEITSLGLEHHLITQWTSFVAVAHEAQLAQHGGPTMNVPTPTPQGVSSYGGGGFSGVGGATPEPATGLALTLARRRGGLGRSQTRPVLSRAGNLQPEPPALAAILGLPLSKDGAPMRLTLLFALALVACKDDGSSTTDSGIPPADSGADPDNDGDGVPASEDCDDNNAEVSPSAAEQCDGLDNNCDGETDEGVLTTFYADADADGYGDLSQPTDACAQPTGASATGDDCDDTNPAIHPNAEETDCADPIDYNCDGVYGLRRRRQRRLARLPRLR
jgi:hypothetical protein